MKYMSRKLLRKLLGPIADKFDAKLVPDEAIIEKMEDLQRDIQEIHDDYMKRTVGILSPDKERAIQLHNEDMIWIKNKKSKLAEKLNNHD